MAREMPLPPSNMLVYFSRTRKKKRKFKKNQQQPPLVILFRYPFVHVTKIFILTADLYSRNRHQTRSAQLQS